MSGLLRSMLGVSLDVVCIPSTQRSEAQFLCACVSPTNGNSSTGLQHQQQQCSFASVVPTPGAAAGIPYSCCCGGQDVSYSSSDNSSRAVVASVRKCNAVLFHNISNQTDIPFPDRVVEGIVFGFLIRCWYSY